ncbi:hypothetical protein PR048_019048 [Dryococelus australis]|uniref:Uncharacterized protein n=1 Tax=Dryococelus australis TaxID=614101 RepID=A0ABQ9H2H4_9NEOP|nr:hypothetical protein PR048_019048 [Dryococelus australis]
MKHRLTAAGLQQPDYLFPRDETQFLVNTSEKDVHDKADDFITRFPDNVSPTFSSQICSVKTSFKGKLEKMISIKEFAD